MADAKGTPPGAKKLYTKEDLRRAKIAMLDYLADLSGGRLLKGCCTQGCCDPGAQEWIINPAEELRQRG